MLDAIPIGLDDIYVPAKHRRALDEAKVEAIAESIIEDGLQTPIQVRRDDNRYVLVTGIHRLEAVRALGEDTIEALVVSARRY